MEWLHQTHYRSCWQQEDIDDSLIMSGECRGCNSAQAV